LFQRERPSEIVEQLRGLLGDEGATAAPGFLKERESISAEHTGFHPW
jgi:hypothetical protein